MRMIEEKKSESSISDTQAPSKDKLIQKDVNEEGKEIKLQSQGDGADQNISLVQSDPAKTSTSQEPVFSESKNKDLKDIETKSTSENERKTVKASLVSIDVGIFENENVKTETQDVANIEFLKEFDIKLINPKDSKDEIQVFGVQSQLEIGCDVWEHVLFQAKEILTVSHDESLVAQISLVFKATAQYQQFPQVVRVRRSRLKSLEFDGSCLALKCGHFSCGVDKLPPKPADERQDHIVHGCLHAEDMCILVEILSVRSLFVEALELGVRSRLVADDPHDKEVLVDENDQQFSIQEDDFASMFSLGGTSDVDSAINNTSKSCQGFTMDVLVILVREKKGIARPVLNMMRKVAKLAQADHASLWHQFCATEDELTRSREEWKLEYNNLARENADLIHRLKKSRDK
ncbi:hypothetical protein IEQ34_012728 [Dendrobium chrysotoxum]|uniref:Uncharacterized protein n=1 Tax=Dendrobium chrysotoxum TaxID=161865 RepID=A0AAV7GPF5_DENCH|nr:hypothetical protein IEQ34_012728 [Dendrobium chrysotoxum]